ncbi:MAG: class I SAM-dependent methyltransferase [Rubrobacter sp.]|nr:class I SAM-dependent methyltransferase [Rubrobacter sp.]
MRGQPEERTVEERERLRWTFDRVAQLYDEARPGYPDELFDGLTDLSGIPPGGRVLEIGSGTGHATVPLARRGYSVLGVELGENLAAVAREKLAGFPDTKVRTGLFEEQPLEGESFDLAVCASAFHWFDREAAYRKVQLALRPGGALALLWKPRTGSGRAMVSQKLCRRSTNERPRRSHGRSPVVAPRTRTRRPRSGRQVSSAR